MIKFMSKGDKKDRGWLLKLSSKNKDINIQPYYNPHFIDISIWGLGKDDTFKHFIKSIKIPLTFKNFKHIRCSKLPGFLYVHKYGGNNND